MQYEILALLKCPVTKTGLRLEVISEFQKPYGDTAVTEIKEGLLFSPAGFVFPVIDGIPRMLVESVYDYREFLQKKLPDYNNLLARLEKDHAGLIQYCLQKNARTKKSFEFEWSFLSADGRDKIWHHASSDLATVLIAETGQEPAFFQQKTTLDVGCGHGFMTSAIATLSSLAIGVEISKAVENAYQRNQEPNAHYLQADLQFLPFSEGSFDMLYSSGVIHHTNNTELSLSLIEPVLKKNGHICLWLYHPQQNWLHNSMQSVRKITSVLPLKISFVLLSVLVFPISFVIKKIKRKQAPNYREEMIDLLDNFTPQYRFEIPHDLARTWLTRRNFEQISITTENQFGFSIAGKKQ